MLKLCLWLLLIGHHMPLTVMVQYEHVSEPDSDNFKTYLVETETPVTSSSTDWKWSTARNVKTHIYTQPLNSVDTEQSKIGLETFVIS